MLAVLGGFAPAQGPAQSPAPPDVAPDLLEGLDDLLEPKDAQPAESDPGARAPSAANPSEGPLAAIAERMAVAGVRLGQGRIDSGTLEVQDAALAAIDQLLEQLGGGSSESSTASDEPRAAPGAPPQPAEGRETGDAAAEAGDSEAPPGPAGGEAEGAAEQGGEEGAKEAGDAAAAAGEAPGRATGGPPGSIEIRAAADVPRQEAIWGHLPPQVRGELRAVRPEEYHPEYREMIEAYYRRLAELGRD